MTFKQTDSSIPPIVACRKDHSLLKKLRKTFNGKILSVRQESNLQTGVPQVGWNRQEPNLDSWDESDDQEWQSLLQTEPAISKQSEFSAKGKNEMLTVARNNVPQGQQQTARGVQFLKPIHATKEGVRGTFYKVTTDKPDNFGNPYVVYLTIGGQKYSKGFKPSSDNLASLVDILGADETKWIKKAVTVFRVVDDEGAERLAFGK